MSNQSSPTVADAEGLIKAGRLPEAEALLAAAVAQMPTAVDLQRRLGILRAQMLDYPAARRALEAAAALAPTNATVIQPLAVVYYRMGQPRLARAAAERLLELAPTNAAAHSLLADLAEPGDDHAPLLNSIKSALAHPSLSLPERSRLSFAGGRLAHLAGDIAEAFDLFHEANKCHAALDDAAGRAALADRLEGAFGEIDWPTFTPAAKLILVTGLPNSGQAFLADVIASHPEVVLATDLNTLTEAAFSIKERSGSGKHFPECVGAAPESAWRAASDSMFSNLVSNYGEASAYVMSAPAAFLQAGAAAALAPGAVIIDLSRAPMAYALSNYMRNDDPQAGYSYSAEGIGRLFRTAQSMMAFWQGVLPWEILSVSDRDLVQAPELPVARILAAVGLDMHGDCEAQIDAVPPESRFEDSLGLDGWRAYAGHLGLFRQAMWPKNP